MLEIWRSRSSLRRMILYEHAAIPFLYFIAELPDSDNRPDMYVVSSQIVGFLKAKDKIFNESPC